MSFVMSAMPAKAAVFTGARASARGSVRTVRAAAVRALSAVVDADPRVLEWEQVRLAVQRRMSDNGTMVRSAVIDLLGKHVVRDARVAESTRFEVVRAARKSIEARD